MDWLDYAFELNQTTPPAGDIAFNVTNIGERSGSGFGGRVQGGMPAACRICHTRPRVTP